MSLRGQFNMEFHHLSPNGKWKGVYSTAHAFYRHIISPSVRVVTVFREPKQQYVSWAYFYHIPNHRPRPPLEVLEEFVVSGKNANPLAGDFGLYTQEQTTHFIETCVLTFNAYMQRLHATLTCVQTTPIPVLRPTQPGPKICLAGCTLSCFASLRL